MMDSDLDGILITVGEDSYPSGPGTDTIGSIGAAAGSTDAGLGIDCTTIGTTGIGSGIGTGTSIGTCIGIGTYPRPIVSPGDHRERCVQTEGHGG